jgi:endogenous inhibitor of DNA gyrase (YacG/DUF329 family)
MAVLHCLVCDKEFESTASTAMPFCSPRCRQIDLGRWLNEEYGLPDVPDPDEAEEESPRKE